MVSVCLPSDALLQHLPSYLGFSYLGHGVSLHGCSSKAQLLLLTLDEGISLLPPFLTFNVGPLGPPAPVQPPLLGVHLPDAGPGFGHGWLFPTAAPGLGLRVATHGHHPWPRVRGGFSQPPLTSDVGCLVPANTDLGHRVAPLGHSCAVTAQHSRLLHQQICQVMTDLLGIKL